MNSTFRINTSKRCVVPIRELIYYDFFFLSKSCELQKNLNENRPKKTPCPAELNIEEKRKIELLHEIVVLRANMAVLS